MNGEPPRFIKPPPKRGLIARLRMYFFTGVVVTAPIGITLWLLWLVVDLFDRAVVPLIPDAYNPSDILGTNVPGVGIVIVLILVTLVGGLFANVAGRFPVPLRRAPGRPRARGANGLRRAQADLRRRCWRSRADAFREVVLIEYPRRGIWVIGFVTSPTKGEVQRVMDEEMVNLFLPTTPNPTSGFLLFVPRKDVIPLDMSVEEGVKLVISGGIVSPPDSGAGAEAGAESGAAGDRPVTAADRSEG